MKPRQLYAVSFALIAFWALGASAQQICKKSGEVPASNSTLTQQHTIDVGDVPGHQIGIYEVHRVFPQNAPQNCEGLRIVEQWGRSFSDYTNYNGRTWGYVVYILENGDKIFSESDGTVETAIGSDGSRTSTYTGVTKLTGGTGKYVGIRGLLRSTVKTDLDKNAMQTSYNMEYWLPK
jgi:hypothetical protein